MKPNSLKHVLLFSVALLVIATGFTIAQVISHRYSVSLHERATAQAENIAHQMALEAVDKILINDLTALQKMLNDQLISNPDIAYLFVVQEGRVLSHTFEDGTPTALLRLQHHTTGNPARIQKLISETGNRYIDVAYPILDGKAGILRMGLSEAPYRRQIRRLWVQICLITSGILVVALIVSHWLITRLLRPLEQLTQYAEQIDAGNLDIQLKISGRREITKLVTAFNSMLSRIHDYTQQLKISNDQLATKHQQLDQAHQQLETSCSISQQLAAFPKLDQICRFLIQTLTQVVTCGNLSLMVFNNAMRSITLVRQNQILKFDQKVYDPLIRRFDHSQELFFLTRSDMIQINLPDCLKTSRKIGLFPIRYHDLLIGAMMAACKEDCSCIRHELHVVRMILNQSAGAIHRANFHEEQLRDLRQRMETETGFSGLIGKDPKMQVVFKLIEDVAPTDTTVLILGESGTGKELVARAIHERSLRSDQPFVVINCAAYPSTLLESELFGYEKGAFTGALRRKIGRFEQASGGTVFLDEIGEIDASAQIKLLRVLQQQTIDRLGGGNPIKVNVRVIAATNKDLASEVKAGRFREDLYYRLNVILVQLPPLRERSRDIHRLARHFLNKFSREHGKDITGFRSEAMRRLIEYPWPGNVRELENSIEHAVVLAKNSMVDLMDLPATVIDTQQCNPAADGQSILTQSEKKLIQETLDECDWNKSEAARRLGISRSTLYDKLKRFQIDKPTA